MTTIVAIQFQKPTKDSAPDVREFGGREYTYYSAVTLSEGDVLLVPTKRGETVGKVIKVGLSESHIDERVRPFMKTIEAFKRPEDRGNNPIPAVTP